MTHWHDSLTWLIDMTHWHESFMSVCHDSFYLNIAKSAHQSLALLPTRSSYLRVMPHIWMHHVTYTNESCRTYVNESCRTFESVMSHISMSIAIRIHCFAHVAHTSESCHTCKWVMSHIWMSHVTHIHIHCYSYAWLPTRSSYLWVMSHIYTSNGTYEWVMSHI